MCLKRRHPTARMTTTPPMPWLGCSSLPPLAPCAASARNDHLPRRQPVDTTTTSLAQRRRRLCHLRVPPVPFGNPPSQAHATSAMPTRQSLTKRPATRQLGLLGTKLGPSRPLRRSPQTASKSKSPRGWGKLRVGGNNNDDNGTDEEVRTGST